MKNEDVFWSIIDQLNWSKDKDYNRIKSELMEMDENFRDEISVFVSRKMIDLYDKYEQEWLSDPGIEVSDDGWSDLRAEIIGRGETFYNEISVKKLKEMALSMDYTESFIYSFLY